MTFWETVTTAGVGDLIGLAIIAAIAIAIRRNHD